MGHKRYIMNLRQCLTALLTVCMGTGMFAQSDQEAAELPGVTSLATFRQLALQNNKQLMIARQRVRKSEYQSKEALAAYLPAIDFNGGYLYNQRDLSIFDSDQMLPIKSFNLETQKYEFDLVTNPVTHEPILNPATGQPIPASVAYLPKEAMTYDIHNVFFGAVTLTQPIFMGGKIVAMNRLARAAGQAARELHNAEAENVIYAVDAAYWQVVSLKAKERLAESYVNLLDSLSSDVHHMYDAGVATRSDVLSVDVKLNSANVDLTKVKNGLVLSRMALAQVCGLPVHTTFTLEDENPERTLPSSLDENIDGYDMNDVYATRPDLRALEFAVKAAAEQKNAERSSMLPKVALIGSYEFSNPNIYNGFKKNFKGAFSVGAMVSIPIWHWGGNYNKYKAAQADEIARQLQLEDARQLVDLQVNQATFKTQESFKTYHMTVSNLAKADENLRSATLGFREGVATADNVMEAQTAWLKAHSEQVDALIDVEMCRAYLSKALGTLYTPDTESSNE